MRPASTAGRKANPFALPTLAVQAAAGCTVALMAASGVGVFGGSSIRPTQRSGL
jgi:hypothetical protein